jgi:hypothetical protein
LKLQQLLNILQSNLIEGSSLILALLVNLLSNH